MTGVGVMFTAMRAARRRATRRIGRIAVLFVLLAAAVLGVAQTAGAQTPPAPSPGIAPPGANDFDCEPPARHPYPVVLVHGTAGDMTYSWNLLSPALKRLGYCVFALDYGNRAIGPIETSAQQVEDFVDEVLAATGAPSVAIVGHSQGGMLPRYLIKFLGGEEKVNEVVGLVPSNHGTTVPLAPLVGDLGCPACKQQIAGSEFITALNAGDETPGAIDYTQITTRYDQVVTPYTSAYLADSGDGRVTNVTVQDACPLDLFEHILFVNDPVALQWTLNALGRAGPAAAGFRPDCLGLALFAFPDSDSTEGASPQPRAKRKAA